MSSFITNDQKNSSTCVGANFRTVKDHQKKTEIISDQKSALVINVYMERKSRFLRAKSALVECFLYLQICNLIHSTATVKATYIGLTITKTILSSLFPPPFFFLLRFNYLSKSHVTTTAFSFDASHNLLSSSDGPARNIFIRASVIILSFAFSFHDLIELYDFML